MNKTLYCLWLAGGALLLASCRHAVPRVRHYTEIRVAAPASVAMNASGMMNSAAALRLVAGSARTGLRLAWTRPAGWLQRPGEGIRAVTFLVRSGGAQAQCSIVPLVGAAGGLAANVQRWMAQLHVTPLTGTALEAFLQKQETLQTKGGWNGTLINFASLVPGQDAGMLAADIRAPGTAVFVKMTGPKALLAHEYHHFKTLCESLRKQ